ncbi:MAG: ABC transporter permease [Candidatus Sulfotelmatobacter sp.]
MRRVKFIANAVKDLRYAGRMLRRSPGFTAAVVITLALGIGANTAIYSIFYATLIADFPYPHSEQLVVVWSRAASSKNRDAVSTSDYLDWKRESMVFQTLGVVRGAPFNLSIGEKPQQIDGDYLTPGFLDELIGDRPFMGRYFLPEEGVAGKDHVAIITHKLWQGYFASDPNIIDKQIHLNGEIYTVIGVQPPGQPDRLDRQIVVPFVFSPEQMNRDARWLVVLGRLKPGITLAQANADMDAVTRHLAENYPKSNKGWGASVEPLKNDFLDPEVRTALWFLLGAVGFVLLIACVNVANLLLARGTTRQKEVAVRASVGASRARIFAQFLTESLTYAAFGGILGVGLAFALLKVIIAMMPRGMLLSEADVRLNLPVLLFTLGTTVLAGILFGCAPAWQATRLNLNGALKEGGRSDGGTDRNILRRGLVVIEFALALSSLAGGGLALHSLWNLSHADIGFPADHLLTFYLPVPQDRLKNAEQINTFYRQLLERVQAIPGVTAVAASTGLPPNGGGFGLPFQIAGKPNIEDPSARPSAGFRMVTPAYFRTFEIRMEQGRTFTDQDLEGGVPVAVVNESFAKKHFSGVDPLKQRVLVEQLTPGVAKLGPPVEWRVVGVFQDVRNRGLRDEVRPEIDVPFAQSPWPQTGIAVRSKVEPGVLTKSIADVVQSMDPNLPLAGVRTMDQILTESRAGDRFSALLFGSFAAIALVLAALGIYGVMSFVVAQRTHEIGVRMALGADEGNLIGLILKEGMILTGVGLVLGFGGAFSVGRAMRGFWYQVGTIDFSAFAIVAAILLGSAVLACYLPARRAAQVDPMQALRAE